MNNLIKLMEMSKKEISTPSTATFEEPDLLNVTNFLIESLKERNTGENNNEENNLTNALIESLKESKKSLNKIKSPQEKKNEDIKRKEMSKNNRTNFLIKNIKEISSSIKKKEIQSDKNFLKKNLGLRNRTLWTNFFNKTLSFSNFSLIYVNKFNRTSTGRYKFSRKSKNVYYKNIYPKKKYKMILKKIKRKKQKDKWELTFKQKKTLKRSFWRQAPWMLHRLWRSIGKPKINISEKVIRNSRNFFSFFKWYIPSIIPYTGIFIKEFSRLTTLTFYKKLYRFNKLYFNKKKKVRNKKQNKRTRKISRKDLLFFHKFFIQLFKFSSIFKFFENSLWLIKYPFYTLFRSYKAKWLNQLIKIGGFFRAERQRKKAIKKKKGSKNILNLIFSQRVFRKNYKKRHLLSKDVPFISSQKINFYENDLLGFSVKRTFLFQKKRVSTRTRGLLFNPKGNYNLCWKGNLTNKKEYDFTYENFRGKFNKNKKLLLLKGEWLFSELIFSSKNPLLIYFRNIHSSSLFFHTGCISIKKARNDDECFLKKDKKIVFGRSEKAVINDSKKKFSLFLGSDYSSAGIFITTLIWSFLNNATKKKMFLYRHKRLPFFFKKWKDIRMFYNFFFNKGFITREIAYNK